MIDHPTTTRPALRLLAMLGLGALLAIAFASPAAAHRNDESYLYLDVTDDALSGTVQFPFDDVRDILGLTLEGTEDDIVGEIEANFDLLWEYALAETSIGSGGAEWDIVPLTEVQYIPWTEDIEPDGLGYVVLPFDIDLPLAEVPSEIDVTFTPFLDEIPDRNNIALILNDWKRGVIDSERNELVYFTADSTSGTIELDDPSQWRNFSASVELGVDHIKTGPDHIFFILVLLLPSVLVYRMRQWQPSPSFGASLWRVLKLVTMFTLAHSITFTLAGMDVLPLPPSKLTEILIALSIAAAALHNLRPVMGSREWPIAFAFGLFHGMGFAGFVDELAVDDTTKLVSLLGRNVGIEIGQAVIVLIVFPALFILSRTRHYRPVFLGGSIALATLSIVWVFERWLEGDYSTVNDLVDRVVYWPRSFWVCVILTVLAAGVYWFERGKGQTELDPPPSDDDDDSGVVPETERVPVGTP